MLLVALSVAALLPWPTACNFELQRKTEKRSDRHDYCQHTEILEGRLQSYRPNDVGGYEKFQAEQYGVSKVLSIPAICASEAGAQLPHKRRRSSYCPQHYDADAHSFDCTCGDLCPACDLKLQEFHGGSSANDVPRTCAIRW